MKWMHFFMMLCLGMSSLGFTKGKTPDLAGEYALAERVLVHGESNINTDIDLALFEKAFNGDYVTDDAAAEDLLFTTSMFDYTKVRVVTDKNTRKVKGLSVDLSYTRSSKDVTHTLLVMTAMGGIYAQSQSVKHFSQLIEKQFGQLLKKFEKSKDKTQLSIVKFSDRDAVFYLTMRESPKDNLQIELIGVPKGFKAPE